MPLTRWTVDSVTPVGVAGDPQPLGEPVAERRRVGVQRGELLERVEVVAVAGALGPGPRRVERVHRLAEADPVADQPQAPAVSAPSVIAPRACAGRRGSRRTGRWWVVEPASATCSSWPIENRASPAAAAHRGLHLAGGPVDRVEHVLAADPLGSSPSRR
jgi:hypothetical protein